MSAGDLLVFQSMQRGSDEIEPVDADYPFFAAAKFDRPGYPAVFHRAQLCGRSHQLVGAQPRRRGGHAPQCGIRHRRAREEEVFVCRRRAVEFGPDGPHAVYPARGKDR